MAFDNDGKVMGGTQDNGTLEIDGENPNLAMSADQVLGGDGFDCDYSNISGAMFATIYNGDVNRADANGSFAPICSSNVSFCGTGSFYTVIRLWETLNQPDSQHKITFKADTTKQGVGSGNGTKKTFTGTLTPLQAGGIIKKGSVKFQAGTTFLYDNDGDGVINAAAGTGTIDYNSGDFSVTFTSTPGVNLAIFAYFVAEYPKGTTLLLNSNTANIQVPHTLTDTLKANDSIVVMDPVQSFLAFGGSNKIYVTRGALDFSKTPQWWDVSAGFSGLVKSMEFSKDGKHLFVGTYGSGLYRLSGFNKLYHKDSVAQYITVTKILTTTQVVTGIAVDPNNPENVVATLGNYGNNIYVMRSTSAASTTGSSSFTSIQGNLPKMPVYDAVINKINPKVCVIGTEYGAYATNDVFANPVVWSDENSTFSHVPVHAVRQQTLDWNYASNNEVIYLGTHGRGIWKSGTLVSTPEIEHVDNSKASFISELSVYPNPLSEAGYISFKLKEASSVNINIYNMQGALVKAFSQEKFNAGTNRFQINTNHLPAGTYFTSVETGANRLVGKFVVVK
jgi:hypothetical protein